MLVLLAWALLANNGPISVLAISVGFGATGTGTSSSELLSSELVSSSELDSSSSSSFGVDFSMGGVLTPVTLLLPKQFKSSIFNFFCRTKKIKKILV